MTTTHLEPVVVAEGAPRAERIPLGQKATAVGIALLTVAVIPGWSSSSWVPKEAVVAALAAAGLPVLLALALDPRRTAPASVRHAARFAVGFVAVALVSALLSKTPALAVVGLFQQGTGWVFVVGVTGCWVLATRLGHRARDLLALLIIFGAVANAVVAVLQVTVGLSGLGLPLYSGNIPDGLQGNPFELGALMAAALALLQGRFRSRPRDWYLPVAVVMIGAGACGERLPLLLIGGVLAWAVWQAVGRSRDRTRQALRRSIALCALSLGGLLAGALVDAWAKANGSIERIAGSTSEETFGQRLMAWREGLRAFSNHLLIGAGPGQFRSVTSALFPLSFMKQAPDMLFDDAHNFVVEYLATTGILGTAALLGWLAIVLKRARGPLAAAAIVLLAIELAEPLDVAVMPVALAALGAAGPLALHEPAADARLMSRDGPKPFGRALRTVVAAMAMLGAAAGALLVTGDGLLQRAEGQYDLAQDNAALANERTAETLLAAWPDPAEAIAETHFYMGLGDHPAERAQGIEWMRVAVSRDPTNPSLWGELASYQLEAGEFRAAQTSALEAQKYEPWYPTALNDLGVASLALGERAEAHMWFAKSLEIAPDQPSVRRLYRGSCNPNLHQIGASLLTSSCGESS